MADEVLIVCDNCNGEIKIPADFSGVGVCPDCGTEIEIVEDEAEVQDVQEPQGISDAEQREREHTATAKEQKKIQRELAKEQKKLEKLAEQNSMSRAAEVVITDIRIPFRAMVDIVFKVVIALSLVTAILGLLGWALVGIAAMILATWGN